MATVLETQESPESELPLKAHKYIESTMPFKEQLDLVRIFNN